MTTCLQDLATEEADLGLAIRALDRLTDNYPTLDLNDYLTDAKRVIIKRLAVVKDDTDVLNRYYASINKDT